MPKKNQTERIRISHQLVQVQALPEIFPAREASKKQAQTPILNLIFQPLILIGTSLRTNEYPLKIDGWFR